MITVDDKYVQKSEEEWTNAEEQASLENLRALIAIYDGVDLNVFKLIKDAWKVLEVAFEGTSKVKISQLQLLAYKFKSFRMMEE